MEGLPDGLLAIPECAITFEQFEEKGRNQPLFLPSCGHTFSREGVHQLLKRAREDAGFFGKRAKGRPVSVKCPQCSMMQRVAVIDDFLPNWSVISQIETLNEQLAADQAKAKAAAAEQQEGSEKENTHSQQHSQQHTNAEHESQHPADGPSDAPAQPEALGADLEHLELSDAPSSDLPKTEADAHHEAQRQVIKEVEYQAQLADMLQASSVANEPCEIPMWQIPYERYTGPSMSMSASSIPSVITQDRASHLGASQLSSHRKALSDDMLQLVMNAVRPYLAGEDLFAVSQALTDVAINKANSTSALLDALARRIPVLDIIGNNWAYIADTCYVESEVEVVKRARRSHAQQEKIENERFRKAAVRHPALQNKHLKCKKDELVRVRVAARLADRAYAGVMGCGGYRLEDSPMEDVAPNESYLQVGKRLFTLETALDHALAYERKADDNDDLLAPALFFRAAAQAFKECLPPMPQTNLQTARVCVLSNMMRSRIELMLKPVYGEEAGTSLAIHATKLLCENSPNADSLLALCSPPNSELELPVIVETAVDYLICSDPSCLEASALSAVLEPPTRPHLDYIRTARANEGFEFTDEGFLTSQEQAIQINAQLHGLQNGSCRHGGMGGRNGAAGRGAGLGNMGVRPARHRSKQEHTTGINVNRRMYGDTPGPVAAGGASQAPSTSPQKPRAPPPIPPVPPQVRPNMYTPNPAHGVNPTLNGFSNAKLGNSFTFNPQAPAHAPPHPHARFGPGPPMGNAHTHMHQQQHNINGQAPPYAHANGVMNGKVHMRAPAARAFAPKPAPKFDPPLIDLPPGTMYKPVDQDRGTQQKLPERPGATPCHNFEKFGWCEFGNRCGNHHPGGVSVKSNLCGYPVRPNVKVCKFYMNTGTCDYKMNCFFNHPNIAHATGPNTGVVLATGSAFDEKL